jgi:asparagine synthase (glutamine-hydrolysing)
MCGIGLVVERQGVSRFVEDAMHRIDTAQAHRGPNGSGSLIHRFGETTVGLCHQRLAIIDLTAASDQPMVSPCGRWVLIYNGEVYNYLELRVELGDDPCLHHSTGDTAVVLAALIRWGAAALNRFNGMWALALLDRETGRLLLSRDRLGVKPLYYTVTKDAFFVASEVKGILAATNRRFRLNKDTVARHLIQALVSTTNDTIFEDIVSLPAATYAEIDLNRPHAFEISPKSFWIHPFKRPDNRQNDVSPSDFRELFLDAVALRLRSDVPVGITLSGGIDSSSILAAAVASGKAKTLNAFSVVSADPAASEEPFIDLMASHSGLTPTKFVASDDPIALWNDIPATSWFFDQPLCNLSHVAHRRLLKYAGEAGSVVLLTGQGSDEQLGGYNKFLYFYLVHNARRFRLLQNATMIAGCVVNRTILNEFRWGEASRYIGRQLHSSSQQLLGPALLDATLADTGYAGSYEEREWLDQTSLSLPMLLTVEDRMSMSHSLEMRVPFLDYRVVEFLARTPTYQKLKNGWTKHILRTAMEAMLPPQIAWRRDKKGYNVPEANWARNELRSRYEELLAGDLLAVEAGLVTRPGVQTLVEDFYAEKPNASYKRLFCVAALELFLRRIEGYLQI